MSYRTEVLHDRGSMKGPLSSASPSLRCRLPQTTGSWPRVHLEERTGTLHGIQISRCCRLHADLWGEVAEERGPSEPWGLTEPSSPGSPGPRKTRPLAGPYRRARPVDV